MSDVTAGSVVTAHDVALAHLRAQIADGRLRPGDQIRQETLAAGLGLSVVPVREALKTLQIEGQVSYFRHRGFFVARLDLDELVETYRIRALLEDEAVARAVARVDAAGIERLEKAIGDIEAHARTRDVPAVTAANRRFHFALFDMAGMPRLTNLVRMLWDSTDPYRSLYFGDADHLALVNAEHRQILDAVRSGDAAAAVALSAAHRDHALTALTEVLAAESAGA